MALTKAVKVIFIRELMESVDAETRATFYAKLSSSEKDYLSKMLSFTKLDTQLVVKIFDSAADVLHPGKSDGVRLLGQALAHDNLTGIYKILLRLVSVPFLVKQAAKIWDTYHEKGIVRCARVKGENTALFLIEDYPEMPKTIRDITTGYIEGALELTGGIHVQVQLDETHRQLWKWRVTWGAEKK